MRFDLFRPGGAAQGTVIYVHGGYWHLMDKTYWSHLSAGALARGWAVAVPSYPLAPEVRISAITQAVRAAVCTVAGRTSGPIALIGHSAGGHLVSRMACAGVLPDDVIGRLKRVVSVSGVHHLAPLLATKMNDTLRLTAEEAAAETPLSHTPLPVPLTFWVGADERPEFLRQTRIIAETWGRKGADVTTHYETGRNHFDVVASLAQRDGALVRALLD
jgi:acetyl esterase/lipase